MYFGSLHVPPDSVWGVRVYDHVQPSSGHWVSLSIESGTIDVHASRAQLLQLATALVEHLAPWCDTEFLRSEPVPQLNTPKEVNYE